MKKIKFLCDAFSASIMRHKVQKMRFLKRVYFDFAHFWIYATCIYVKYCVKVAVLVFYWFRSYSDLKLHNRTNFVVFCVYTITTQQIINQKRHFSINIL